MTDESHLPDDVRFFPLAWWASGGGMFESCRCGKRDWAEAWNGEQPHANYFGVRCRQCREGPGTAIDEPDA